MWSQVAVIVWAQWRTTRNHLPRLGLASILGNALSLLWYAFILSIAVALAIVLPLLAASDIRQWLSTALLGIVFLWQVVPLFTLSTGWSLQLKKLQIYPVRTEALFGIEVLLRITASPEMILIMIGGTIGLLRHPELPAVAPLFLLLLLPINLLLSLAVRELVLHSFERNRFRELFSLFVISLAVLPQAILRSGLGSRSQPYIVAVSKAPFTPWSAAANLVLGPVHTADGIVMLFWVVIGYLLARWFFVRSLRFEETPQSGSLAVLSRSEGQASRSQTSGFVAQLLRDPLAALVQKELQSLIRMPRFRVAFGMACIFSVIILLPLSINVARAGSQFVTRNFLPLVTMYGLLILSDSLLLNVFGTDRSGVAFYFVAPVSIRTVLQAKNLVAALFLAGQSVVVILVVAVVRRSLALLDVITALSAVAVVAVFFLSIGNLTSVMLAGPADPKQTMRKAAGGKLQLWLLLCMLSMGLLLGAAYWAQWAFDSYWALYGVLAVEFAVGLVFYRVAVDSAVEHADRDREKLIDALSKGAALIGSNT